MNILVINCGSSSLKYQLINMNNEEALAQGLVERIGIEGSGLTQKVEGRDKYVVKKELKNHTEAIKLVLSLIAIPNVLLPRSNPKHLILNTHSSYFLKSKFYLM